ncbi:MAG: hypothetical protein JSR82_07565 [Verrucomicrobia bacterium]|nr:hypothetical protein [Verrucomicrobiota bacterium]
MLADGTVLELHGFFASLEVPGAAGFLYLRSRHQAYVHFGAKPDATGRVAGLFTRASGPGRSHFHAVSARFLGWIEAYETWLEREFGPTYRERSYAAYPHRWKAPRAAREWFSRYLHCPTSP